MKTYCLKLALRLYDLFVFFLHFFLWNIALSKGHIYKLNPDLLYPKMTIKL